MNLSTNQSGDPQSKGTLRVRREVLEAGSRAQAEKKGKKQGQPFSDSH